MADASAWRSRWHIVADGTIIKQWSKGEEVHQQVFRRFESTRRPDIADLVAIDEKGDRFGTSWGRVTSGMLWLGALAVIGVLSGLFILPLLGAGAVLSMTVLIASAAVIVIISIAAVFIGVRLRTGVPQHYADAGIEVNSGETMAATEARAKIADSDTVSSEPVSSKGP
ncbi:MAG: hypothetical protein ACTH2Q_17130 [Propionibacteriaceae bacterium]